MLIKRLLYLVLAATLIVPLMGPGTALAQAPAAAQTAPKADLATRLAAIEAAIDARRKELGIPGIALAIVKDDKVVYAKGLGLRDLERKLPVTPDTLFAIGSASKAFTGMSVVMAADDGRLSLDDAPRKYLPYFKLQDPEANEKITIRDLLCHRSGLTRTDLGWATGVLTSEEIIRVAGEAKPSAKLGEKFQYQNVMYLAAGEVVGKAMGSSWERVLSERIFKPLGMASTNVSVDTMQKAKDHALGYEYNATTKQTIRKPMRNLDAIAPAGAINSNARDMAQWVRLMLGGGEFEGKQLVSAEGFKELVSPHMKVGGPNAYGLGWFLRDWKGHKVVEHGGNIDGFNSQVALMPDQKLGFVLLTNVSASSLGPFAMQTIWTNFLEEPADPAALASGPEVAPEKEAGTYLFPEAGFDIVVAHTDGVLTMTVPGQPVYPLERVSGRRYKLGSPAPAGFFATFRPAKEDASKTEMYLEQPHGNYVLARKDAAAATEAKADAGELGELVGSYRKDANTIEIALVGGKVSLVVPGQPPYPLFERSKDLLGSTGLPDTYGVKVERNGDGKVTGIVLKQPNGDFAFTRAEPFKSDLTVDELMAKTIEAVGGEEAIRRHATRRTEVEMDLENQGVRAEGVLLAKAPNLAASEFTFYALGKKIGTTRDYFDGTKGGEDTSFSEPEELTGRQLVNAKVNANFHGDLDWRTLYAKVEIKRMDKVGDEEVYVVAMEPDGGTPIVSYISAQTFLPLKQERVQWSETASMGVPYTITFADYREVDGLKVPFTVTTESPANGRVVMRVTKLEHGVTIPDSAFQ